METKEMKFKAGDIVRVLPLSWYDYFKDKYGNVMPKNVGVNGAKHYFTKEMAKWCGTYFEIDDVIDGGYKVYGINLILEDWMIENKKFNRNENKIEDSMETKKMTLAEAQELVKNTKYIVFSAHESEHLQKKLFEIGCRWLHSNKIICNTEHPFLMVDEFLNIRYRIYSEFEYFSQEKKRFIETDRIFNIEIQQEPKKEPKQKFDPRSLKPFDKVLVKNDGEIWSIDFYDRYNSEVETYFCVGGVFTYCIPYNEETKYLHGNGNKEPEFYQQD